MAADGEGLDQESGGDQWQLMVRQEIESYMGSMLGPGGTEGIMDLVVQQTVSKVLESLPPLQVDNDGIARTAARMVKGELMAEEAPGLARKPLRTPSGSQYCRQAKR